MPLEPRYPHVVNRIRNPFQVRCVGFGDWELNVKAYSLWTSAGLSPEPGSRNLTNVHRLRPV